jgi:myosin-heavy-chain kinase
MAANREVRVPAVRYDFDVKDKSWSENPTTIFVPDPIKPIASGGMRDCYDIQEIDANNDMTFNVAKFFMNDDPPFVEMDYFNEAMTQRFSEQFARKFNRFVARDPNAHISFIACHVVRVKKQDVPLRLSVEGAPAKFFSYRLRDTQDTLFVMESKLDGVFTKYNSNYGALFERAPAEEGLRDEEEEKRKHHFLAAEAFSHFTLAESRGKMLVCDLQGINDLFTDPQILTSDGDGLGMGNMGIDGIRKWRQAHRCNDICRAKQLPELDENGVPLAVDAAEPSSYAAILDALISDAAHRGGAAVASRRVRRSAPPKANVKHPSEMTYEERMALSIERSLRIQ